MADTADTRWTGEAAEPPEASGLLLLLGIVLVLGMVVGVVLT